MPFDCIALLKRTKCTFTILLKNVTTLLIILYHYNLFLNKPILIHS